MTIPRVQKLTPESVEALSEVAEGKPYFQRLVSLQLALPWMNALEAGDRLFIEAEEWVNKMSGKCSFELIRQDEDGDEITVQEWSYYVFFPGHGLLGGLERMFPWANFSNDDDYYFRHEEKDEWRIRDDGPRPYEDNGETAAWRLELTLNDLGKAFLRTDSFLRGE